MLLTEEYKNLSPIDSSLLGTVIDLKYGDKIKKTIPITPNSKLEAVKLKTKETHRFDYVVENILSKPEVAMIIFRAENRQLIAVAMDNDETTDHGKNIISMMSRGKSNSYSSAKYIIVWTDFATEPFNDYPNTWIEGYSSDNYETTASKNRVEKLISDTIGGYYDAKTRMVANKIGLGSAYSRNELTDEQKNELKVAVGKRTWNILVLYKDPALVDLKTKRLKDKEGSIPTPSDTAEYENYKERMKDALKSRLVKYKIDRLPNIKKGEQLESFFTSNASRIPTSVKIYNNIWNLSDSNSILKDDKIIFKLRYSTNSYKVPSSANYLYAYYELNMPTNKTKLLGLNFTHVSRSSFDNNYMDTEELNGVINDIDVAIREE